MLTIAGVFVSSLLFSLAYVSFLVNCFLLYASGFILICRKGFRHEIFKFLCNFNYFEFGDIGL